MPSSIQDQMRFAREANTDPVRQVFNDVIEFHQHHTVPVSVMNRELAGEAETSGDESDEPLFGEHLREAARTIRKILR